MKLKYAIAALAAVIGIAVSCEKEADSYLDEVRVSSSYIGLPSAGGSQTITVKATDSWSVTGKVPSWLTISPINGAAGETNMTFTATAATATRDTTITLTCAGMTQLINVIQQTIKTALPVSTCEEVLGGVDGKSYRIKGPVTAISNTSYGNVYVNDGTGSVYVYGLLKDGSYPKDHSKGWEGFGIEVGDIITVEGPRTTYGSTIELVDAELIEVEKSLIKVNEDPENVAKEGGEFTVELTNKGDGVSVVIPDNAKSWLSVTSVVTSGTTTTVTFLAQPNEGGIREEALTFTTTKDGKTYSAQTKVTQEGSIVETTVEEICNAPDGTAQFRVTGYVTSRISGKYTNYYITDYSGTVQVYDRNVQWTEHLGHIITIVGSKTSYNQAPEMVSITVEKDIDVTDITVAEFLEKSDDKNVWYRLSGTAVGIKDTDVYGNFNLRDATGEVYVYGLLNGWGGPKKQFQTLGIKEGDSLTIVGYRTSFTDKQGVKTDEVGGAFFVSKD